METDIEVKFWRKNTWPYSIDDKPDGAKIDSITVSEHEIFERDGKRYYKMECGIGVSVDLLVT